MIKKVIITIKERDVEQITSVTNELSKFNMKLESSMPDYGILTGEVDSSQIKNINDLPWVESIEEDSDAFIQ